MSKRHGKMNNRGVSLVELVVVIAILSIVGASMVTLMGLVPRSQVSGCTKDLVFYLEKARTNSLSFKDAKLYLADTEQGVYVMLETTKGSDVVVSNPEKIGDKNLEISYEAGGGSAVALTEVTYSSLATSKDGCLAFSFDRSSGSFKDVYLGTDNKGVPAKLTIKRGRWEMEINLVQLTGKVTYNWKE